MGSLEIFCLDYASKFYGISQTLSYESGHDICKHFQVNLVCFLFWMNKDNWYSSNHHCELMLSLAVTMVNFSQQGNAIFHLLWSLAEWPGSNARNCVLKYMSVLSVSFCVDWTRHWDQLVFYLFQSFYNFLYEPKFVFPPLFVYEVSILYYCLGISLICSWFIATAIAYWKQLSL